MKKEYLIAAVIAVAAIGVYFYMENSAKDKKQDLTKKTTPPLY